MRQDESTDMDMDMTAPAVVAVHFVVVELASFSVAAHRTVDLVNRWHLPVERVGTAYNGRHLSLTRISIVFHLIIWSQQRAVHQPDFRMQYSLKQPEAG